MSTLHLVVQPGDTITVVIHGGAEPEEGPWSWFSDHFWNNNYFAENWFSAPGVGPYVQLMDVDMRLAFNPDEYRA